MNRIVHIENIRLKPFAKVSVFIHSLYWSNKVSIVFRSWGHERWRRPYQLLALKARLISAMGEAHGLDIQGCSWVLAEITSIGKIRVRQNGWTVILDLTVTTKLQKM